MLFTFRKFLHHYASATLIDVLHSPFVFRLYNTCLKRNKNRNNLTQIDTVWQKALHNKTIIEQKDFGAQGLINPQRSMPVLYYAKYHANRKRVANIIHQIISQFEYRNCIEIGTSLGYTSMHIASALPTNSTFITIEGAPDIAKQAIKHFEEANLSHKIEVQIGAFNTMLPKVLERFNHIDFAYIDGNHTYEATVNYFKQLLAKKQENTLLIFDDIYWSKGMTRAWEEIKVHPEVRVTVDLFFVGLVYFKTDQRKQNFKLRLF